MQFKKYDIVHCKQVTVTSLGDIEGFYTNNTKVEGRSHKNPLTNKQ